MTAQTPTGRPWQIAERFNKTDDLEIIGGIDSVDGDYGVPEVVCTRIAIVLENDDQEANAAYILKACNAYPDLVKAIKAIFDAPTMTAMVEAGPAAHKLLVELGEAEPMPKRTSPILAVPS